MRISVFYKSAFKATPYAFRFYGRNGETNCEYFATRDARQLAILAHCDRAEGEGYALTIS